MKFSIIIPSYNQSDYIEKTLRNVFEIKEAAKEFKVDVEILLFDSESNEAVLSVIKKYQDTLDVIEIKKDKGQFDAINKGILKCTGDYWTWLNTDDTLDLKGFLSTVEVLRKDPAIDYIYGSVDYMNENDEYIRSYPSYLIDLNTMVTKVPAIFQQGSFFKKKFTDKIGLLKQYDCCFDYEYVLRCLKNGAKVYSCDFKVANFRLHSQSKTGSIIPRFIKDQLVISKEYGRKWYHFLSWFSHLRLIKHKIFPRK
ncbi:MAG TPA: glycosyltransferase [Bacteroidia bacterium]|nr:glycosyltransferase [Bacteroidia bacterium]